MVASVVLRAALQTTGEDSPLATWARRHLRRGDPNDPVSEQGFDRKALPFGKCSNHADRALDTSSSEAPCLGFVRSLSEVVGDQLHRSGWPFAFESLQPLACSEGILFDDFVEHRFCYQVGAPGYQEPWIGIFHHPPDDYELAGYRNSLSCMFETRFWKDSEPHLIGGITLSEHLAEFLRDRLRRKFVTVMHPVAKARRKWSPEAFLANEEKKLVQIGWYLRNTHAIFEVGPIDGFTRWRLQHQLQQMTEYNDRVAAWLNSQGRSVIFSTDVVDRGYVPHDEYDEVLTSNVIFCELLAASANNVILDCIAACSPIVVNRHPAVVEYLGPDYPLYYNDISEVQSILATDTILAGHEYLNQLDATHFSGTRFRRAVADAVRKIAT